jgi:Ca2+-binding EF-hand superfamily protein
MSEELQESEHTPWKKVVPVPKLSPSELKLCNELAAKHKGADFEELKKISLQSRSKLRTREIKSVEDLRALLAEIKYFEKLENSFRPAMQTEDISEEAKARVMKCVKMFVNDPEYQLHIAKGMFEMMDQDHSGSISLKEILTGFTILWAGDEKEQANFKFDAWDADGSGTLSREEVREGWINAFIGTMRIISITVAIGFLVRFCSKVFFKAEELSAEESKLVKEILFVVQKSTTDHTESIVKKIREGKIIEKIVDAIFKLVDTNNDNVLTKEEYVSGMTDANIVSQIQHFSESAILPFSNLAGAVEEGVDKWVDKNIQNPVLISMIQHEN